MRLLGLVHPEPNSVAVRCRCMSPVVCLVPAADALGCWFPGGGQGFFLPRCPRRRNEILGEASGSPGRLRGSKPLVSELLRLLRSQGALLGVKVAVEEDNCVGGFQVVLGSSFRELTFSLQWWLAGLNVSFCCPSHAACVDCAGHDDHVGCVD